MPTGFGVSIENQPAQEALTMSSPGSTPLKVISAGAVEFIITPLGSQFTRETGVPVSFTFNTIAGVRKRLADGEPGDIVIGTTTAIRQLEEAGTVVGGSHAELGRTRTGICVRAGSPLPDISTPEAFKALLVGARSFAYTDPKAGGTSGIFLEGLMERLGILAEVKAKSVMCINGEDVVRKVVSGQAELGSTFLSEFDLVDGVASAGALPEAFGNATSYSAALLATGRAPDTARRFIALLKAPASRAAWAGGGFEPA